MTTPNVEILNKIEVTEALKAQMLAAGTAEELTACWESLYSEANLKDSPAHRGGVDTPDSLAMWLRMTHDLFVKLGRFACDTPVKELWQDQELMAELDNSGIPREFLLQTVRVGSLKELLESVSGQNRHEPKNLHPDGTVARQNNEAANADKRSSAEIHFMAPGGSVNLDGYSWANSELQKIKSAKIEAEKAAKELAAQQLATRKATTIQQMAAPSYEPTKEQKEMLRDDFQDRLRFWKAMFEMSEGREVMEDFRTEHGDKPLDQSIFEELSKTLSNAHAFRRYSDRLGGPEGALQILNPQSGWYYVIVKNGVTTFNDFLQKACCNMGDWFTL